MDMLLTSPGAGWPAGNALGFGASWHFPLEGRRSLECGVALAFADRTIYDPFAATSTEYDFDSQVMHVGVRWTYSLADYLPVPDELRNRSEYLSVGLLVGHAAVDATSPSSGQMGDEGSGAGIYFEWGWIVARERVRTELGFRSSLIPGICLWDAVEYDGVALHVRSSVPF